MASYLHNSDPRIYQVAPFLPDKESINRALMYRQGMYDQGIAKIQGVYSDMLGLDISNAENKQRLSDFMTKAKQKLNSVGRSDFSIQDNVNAANRIFEPITQDKYIINDVATTKHFRNQFSVAEDLRTKDKGVGYSSTNLRYVQNAYEKFVTSKGNDQFGTEKREYTPYVDYMAEINKTAKDIGLKVSVDTATGGYIITEKNGGRAAAPLKDLFMNTLSSQAKDQMRIESTVGYEDAIRIEGEDAVASKIASRYYDGLSRQNKQLETNLSDVTRYIKEIKAKGGTATIQELAQLKRWEDQETILSDNFKRSNEELKNIGGWSIDDKKRYGAQLAYETYAESRAHNWATAVADNNYEYSIKKDDAYWTNLELQRNLAKDQAEASEKAKKAKEEKNPDPNSIDLQARWLRVGQDPMSSVGVVDYNYIHTELTAAETELSEYRRGAMDKYWGNKAEGQDKPFSNIFKAMSAKQDNITLGQLVNHHNTDPDQTNNMDLAKYATALGVTPDKVAGMTVKEVFDKMNSGWGTFLANSNEIQSGDLTPYEYEQGRQTREEVVKYYQKLKDDVNKAARKGLEGKALKHTIKTNGFQYTDYDFINADGTLKSQDQVLDMMDSRGLATRKFIQGGTGVDVAGNTYVREDHFATTKDGDLIVGAYQKFKKTYDNLRNESAKTVSQNLIHDTYVANNIDHTGWNEPADIVSQKLLHNIQGLNFADFEKQFTKEEFRFLQGLNTSTKDLVASVFMTPRGNGKTDYKVTFNLEQLGKFPFAGSKSVKDALFTKLSTQGIVFNNVRNINELAVFEDKSRFVIDRGGSLDRNFGANYNFKVFKNQDEYKIRGTRLVPVTDANGNLAIKDGQIQWTQEQIDQRVDMSNQTIDNALAIVSQQFYEMNAAYSFANLSDTVAKLMKDPSLIKNAGQLVALTKMHYDKKLKP